VAAADEIQTAHRRRAARLQAQLAQAAEVRLAKRTSNLFRDRAAAIAPRLDVHDFDHVLAVDAAGGWVDAEGMVPYDALADACLERGVMPAVVPELKSITLGGALAGIGIEATSFRRGLVHDTVLEFDVLTGAGDVVTARPDNEHADLYFGFPNSYGTLGYALRVRGRTIPVKPYVAVEHRRFARADEFFAQIAAACAQGYADEADFVDGVVFGRDELVLNVARFAASAPYTSDYTYRKIYYRSLREREFDYLTVRDYLWRWDTDWFWCSKNVGAQNPLLRRLYGRERLNSRTYQRIMRWNSRLGLTRRFERLSGWHRESIIQDVDVPLARAPEFLDFYLREIGLLPLWICPIGATADCDRFALFPRARTTYVNFGFWDVKRTREPHPPGHFNRLIERKVIELGGIKSLYSDSYFAREQFDAAYGGDAYRALKSRYDPAHRLGDLFAKCVLKH
jgi:FAD/FMN-containing dehydrogenase